MEWWGYAIVAGSIVSQGLAWAAKLKWSAEYKNAKEAQIKSLEETIKSKDAHVALLEREIQSLRELTPMKLREYLVSSTQTLEEYNNSLQNKIEELNAKSRLYEEQIQSGVDEIVGSMKNFTSIIKDSAVTIKAISVKVNKEF